MNRNEQLLKNLDELSTYIKSTFGEHYSKDAIECFDILENVNCARDFCHGNSIKYLIRYGRKNGKNKMDLMKSLHYILLLMYYDNNIITEDEK